MDAYLCTFSLKVSFQPFICIVTTTISHNTLEQRKNHFATVSEQHVFNHTKAFLSIKTFTPTISLKTCMG